MATTESQARPTKVLSLTRTPTSTPPSLGFTIKLIKKNRNSPHLSVFNYLIKFMKENQDINIKTIWPKYRMTEEHSLLIKQHNLTYNDFKDIAETVMATYYPYQMEPQPILWEDSIGTFPKKDELTAETL